MAGKNATVSQKRVRLKDDTIKQVKLLAILLQREDWNVVMDDMIRVGIAYTNEAAGLELVGWKGDMELLSLKDDLKLTTLSGELPGLERD